MENLIKKFSSDGIIDKTIYSTAHMHMFLT